MYKILKIIFLSLCFLNLNLNASNEVKIIPPQSKFDASHDYFYGLLEKVLENTKDKYGESKVIFSSKMEQGRAFLELNRGKKLDVYWAGTSLEREDKYLAISIPLVKGLLGYRKFIINKENESKFDNIKTFEDLKQLKACQGTHWPDTKILNNAGLKVVKNTNYELMFLQVKKNRCDYFPRGIHEIVSEMESRKTKYPELKSYENIILYYPFPMYFFVSKQNEKLAHQIKEGLLDLIESNEFEKYLQNHSVTKHLFPLDKWMNTKVFKLDNPFMSKDVNINDDKFWIIKH